MSAKRRPRASTRSVEDMAEAFWLSCWARRRATRCWGVSPGGEGCLAFSDPRGVEVGVGVTFEACEGVVEVKRVKVSVGGLRDILEDGRVDGCMCRETERCVWLQKSRR